MYPIRLILRPILVCCILLNSVAVANNNAWYDLVGTREIKSVSFKNILVKGGFQEDSQNETEWHRALAKLLRKRRPILIKNSPVSRWAAIDAWKDGDYFTKQGLKKVEKVRRSSHPVFVYEDNTRMLGKENEEEEGEEDGQRGGEKKKGKRGLTHHQQRGREAREAPTTHNQHRERTKEN